jgi:hypothetical protein
VTYFMYQSLIQAERPKSAAEQRQIDRANGELAAAFAELGHSAAAPWRRLRRTLYRGQRRPLMSAPRPLRRTDARVDGLVPHVSEPEDYGSICSPASSSPDCTRQLARK